MPDMIISDLMMPNMDGLQLTDRLKNDTSTSHIPIILLTAKSAIESRLEALKYGADDYITKPFSPEYLMTRIENILRQRKNLQETYRSSLLSLQPKQLKEQSPDETFLAHLLEYMERNMDNSDLTVDDLVREMTLGRTVFFNKLKSLTGLSPVEFIREVRIKRAAQLLEKGHYNVTEITYMVGMNDSRYFAKCFKNAFGVTPTEYKKSLQTDEAGNNAEENEK
jgi:YesN/AraC family two-component response regulator